MFSRFSSSTFKINVCLKKEISRAIRLIIPVCSVCYSLASFAYHKLISCSRQLSGFCLIFGDKWWFLCAGHQYLIRIFLFMQRGEFSTGWLGVWHEILWQFRAWTNDFFVPCEQIYWMQFLLGTFSVEFSFFFFIRKQIWLLQMNPREFHSQSYNEFS